MDNSGDSIIFMDSLNVHFKNKHKNKHILRDICCQIPKNKITVIIGQSGCGKSTFLKSINRIVEEEGGRITGRIQINNQDLLDVPKEILRKQVGLVFQSPAIFPFSIKKNMLYALNYHYNLSAKEQHERVTHYLDMAGLYEEIKEDLNMSATKLSGGQKQRLSIARCLCIEPQVLMLDEPCSALDIRNTLLIENLLVKLKQSISIVLVTHNLSQAKRIADYVLFIDDGMLIEANDCSIYSSPKEELTKSYMKYMDY